MLMRKLKTLRYGRSYTKTTENQERSLVYCASMSKALHYPIGLYLTPASAPDLAGRVPLHAGGDVRSDLVQPVVLGTEVWTRGTWDMQRQWEARGLQEAWHVTETSRMLPAALQSADALHTYVGAVAQLDGALLQAVQLKQFAAHRHCAR